MAKYKKITPRNEFRYNNATHRTIIRALKGFLNSIMISIMLLV